MTKPTISQPDAHSGRKAELSASSEEKPTFTRLSSSGATRKNYVVSKPQNTHSGMLHQSQTLKGAAVDKPQDRHETGDSKTSIEKSQLAYNIVEMSEPGQPGSVTTSAESPFGLPVNSTFKLLLEQSKEFPTNTAKSSNQLTVTPTNNPTTHAWLPRHFRAEGKPRLSHDRGPTYKIPQNSRPKRHS